MAKQIFQGELAAIEQALRSLSGGASAQQILHALALPIPLRTLQYRLKYLVTHDRLIKDGDGRWARYRLPAPASHAAADGVAEEEEAREPAVPLSSEGASVRNYVRQPPEARKPVGYDRTFLDAYRPNTSFYLSENERAHLATVGRPQIAEQPAGTYAKQILSRLLIDLAWNSSRLEGNTYSLLDTKRLIELGQEAEGRAHLEAQMILNHKDAIEFLVSAADEIGFNRYTILNLHGLLANNLLADPTAAGRLRYIAVGIERSAFHPLEVPQLIEECFDQFLATAAVIKDPFEQALFVMVQLPYLQPFDDVNKRVSRLAANIPLIKGNLSPLSFADVSRQIYPETFLARLSVVAEGATEVGFTSALLRRALGSPLEQHGIHVSDGAGHENTLGLLEALAEGGLGFGGFADDEGGKYPDRWKKLSEKLGKLLFRWPSRCIEQNVIGTVPDDKLEALVIDPTGEKTGMRLRTLADRLGIEEKDFASIKAKAGSGLKALIIEAALGTVPAGKENEKNHYKSHAGTWFKSVSGGRELESKVFDLGLWRALNSQLLPFCNAIRKAVDLPDITDLPM